MEKILEKIDYSWSPYLQQLEQRSEIINVLAGVHTSHNYSQLRKPAPWKGSPKEPMRLMINGPPCASRLRAFYMCECTHVCIPTHHTMHNAFKISSFMLSLIINVVCSLDGCMCNLSVWYVARVSMSSFLFAVTIWPSSSSTHTGTRTDHNIHNIAHTQNTNKTHTEPIMHTMHCVVGRECLLWPVRSLGKTLLAFALLHSVLQGQICLFLDFLLFHSSHL